MAGKRLDIMDFKQLVRLRLEGLSNRRIADLLKISRNTVNEYSRLLAESGLTPEDLLTLDDGGLKDLLAPESEVATERYEQLASSFEYFSAELRKPGCTLLTLWHEYRQRHPEGYQYTQFTHHYNQ